MTLPRMCLAGTTYLVTRTVHNRQFLLVPSEVVNGIVMYCAARAAMVTEVELHWIFAHVNHIHLGVTDFDGDSVSNCMQMMNRLIACCLEKHYEQVRPA